MAGLLPHPLLLLARPLALVATLAALAAPAAASPSRLGAEELTMLERFNELRAERGLSLLRVDRRLQNAARWMSRDMARTRYRHVDSLGRDPFTRMAAFGYPTVGWRGEVLDASYAEAEETLGRWLASPRHRAILLDRHFRAVGIARFCADGSEWGCYWVADFGGRVLAPL